MSETKAKAGADAPNYKKTLNLPKTAFPMKANLVQNEPASQKRWARIDLYARLREARKDSPRYSFHDGPPYANGSIHLGHLMNKCLKDFVVRSRSMMGFDCPFVPGWDCHGLPIEHKVMTEMVESGKAAKLADLPEAKSKTIIRSECQKYAEKYVKLQTGQMQRLLTLADYGAPYLTMKPAYEGAVLDVLADLIEKGLVYRALKPVHWSIANETALAEAELEYQDREDLSVYVDFEAADGSAVYDAFGVADDDDRPGLTPSFMIWTTTPWTLPANYMIAVHEGVKYALVRIDGNITVLAEKLINKVTEMAGSEDVEVLATCMGDKLVGLKYRHPFIEVPASGTPVAGHKASLEKVWTIVTADYVTTEDGTGLVHTAPGHGADDYATGLKNSMPVYCPVQANGDYDQSVPEWIRGMSIWDANEKIATHVENSGHLFYKHRFDHSYPHDWRSKTPVIFRCTEQWFVSVDQKAGEHSLRKMALERITSEDDLKFVPAWGRNRFRGMLESRPDWCISRQRSWGLPIPAFVMPDESSFMTAAVVRAIATLFRETGSNAWFGKSASELLAHYDPRADSDAPEAVRSGEVTIDQLAPGGDILDVWFESGTSWNAVMRQRFGDEAVPVEVYLEGSDQHRGWFQTSILPALGVLGTPPYKAILTHGFCVNKEGKKLSKSSGDSIEQLFEKYGADVLRWWVCSLSYEGDVKVDDDFFKLAGESYRKIRNTLRFCLSNLMDFNAETDAVDLKSIDPKSPEAWILADLDAVTHAVRKGYESFDFKSVHNELYDFCNDALSSVYLALAKDRLYCDKPDSPRRRRSQTALHLIADRLCRLLAPVLCHTADEAFRDLHGDDGCVHLETFTEELGLHPDAGWQHLDAIRDDVLRALEGAKSSMDLENPLDAGVTLPDPDGVLGGYDADDLADLFGVSRAAIGGSVEIIDLRDQPRCDRSRKRHETVKERSDGGTLCDRCADAVGVG
ncbi:MAG: isoleucine--tRNA ligase [Planctomycetota bacterium]